MNVRYSERKILFRANDEGVIHTSNESINASQSKGLAKMAWIGQNEVIAQQTKNHEFYLKGFLDNDWSLSISI